jgi:antagonist of KipI
MGTIQVTGAGHLILLMADRQTTGGYPRLANVIAADLGLAGQLKPGDGVSFVVCTAEAARDALVDRSGMDRAGEDSGRKRRYDSST